MKVTWQTARAWRADRLVAARLPFLGGGFLRGLFRKKEVKTAGKPVAADDAVAAGETLAVFLPDPRRDFARLTGATLLAETDGLVAFDKPAGVTSVPGVGTGGASLIEAASFLLATELLPVHRLDRDTSGVLLFAKNAATASRLENAFRTRTAAKIYFAVVHGVPKIKSGWFNSPLRRRGEKVIVDSKGQPAETRWEFVKTLGRDYALLRLEPKTGRTHQLRVHLATAGHPIVGDRVYGTADGLPRHLLHAAELTICGQKFTAPLPVEMAEFSGLPAAVVAAAKSPHRPK